LLVTNGSVHTVAVPAGAVAWGLVSALALAFYTLFPTRLMQQYGTLPIVGWAMFLGGLACSLVAPPWRVTGQHWSIEVLLLVGFVVLGGSLLAFYLYLASTRYISPTEAGLAACVEPLSAAVASVLWLHTHLGVATLLGGLSILGTVTVLSLKSGVLGVLGVRLRYTKWYFWR
jgi:drug/metabolite transporter (DMT)-like permease